MKKFSVFLSTLFYAGYFPFAPGTFASLLTAILYYLLPVDLKSVNFTEFFIIILIFGFSIPIISKAETVLGHDNKKIVLDEFLGYLVSVLFFEKKIIILVSAFVLFRIFDIFKPEPVDSMQKLPRGLGVVMDDIFAGIYSNVILRTILYALVSFGIINK